MVLKKQFTHTLSTTKKTLSFCLCFVLAVLISITYTFNLNPVISYAICRYVSVDYQRITQFLTVFKLGTIHIKGSRSLCTGSIFVLIPRYSQLINALYSQSSWFSTFSIPKLNPVRNRPLSTPLNITSWLKNPRLPFASYRNIFMVYDWETLL